MSNKARIVILGGGYAGVHTAKQLHKRYKRNMDVEITLIDRNPYHTLMTELHEIAGSRTEPEAVQVSFHKIFGGKNVNVVIDEIENIDFEKQTLKSLSTEYRYDYLVIGAGGAPEFFDIPGVQENSFTLWSLEDAIRIRTHVENCFRAAAKEPDPEKRRQLLTFTIAGAGFTGVELAGELLEHRDVLCPKYHIDQREVRVIIIEAQGNVLPILPDGPRRAGERRLKRMGAEIMLNAAITGAAEGKVHIGDMTVHTSTFVWTAGVHGGELSSRLELTKGHTARGECSVASPEGIHGMAGCHFDDEERYVVGQRGRLLVNDQMQSVDHKNVFVVGDMLWFVEEEKVLPQVVETALQTAHTAAKNIIADIEKKERHSFKSAYHGFMVSIGSRYGVAHVMGVSLYGFMALAVKHLINLHYLFELAGLNACWEYMREEFFRIKNGRSIVHSHLSAGIPAFWAFPLRVFIGIKWLLEGVKKIKEGWLNPGAGGIFNPDTSRINLPGVRFGDAVSGATDAGSAATDAASAATGAAGDAAAGADWGAAADWGASADWGAPAADAWSAATDAVSAATDAAASGGGGDWGQPIMEAWGIYTWFAENVLGAAPWIAYLAQASVVLMEVAIGLMFIVGFLTFPAAAVSIALSVMFMISGWGNVELLWYLAASIVLLGGAGRSLGCDHYTTPWIARWWSGTTFAKRTYLYTGEPRD